MHVSLGVEIFEFTDWAQPESSVKSLLVVKMDLFEGIDEELGTKSLKFLVKLRGFELSEIVLVNVNIFKLAGTLEDKIVK